MLKIKSLAKNIADTNSNTLVTAGSASALIVNSIIISNTHASTNSTITVQVTDSSESVTVNLVTSFPMNAQTSEELLSRPLTMEHNDVLKVTCAAANVFDVYVSYVEKARNE